jgi:opacity protein-like surface antigen
MTSHGTDRAGAAGSFRARAAWRLGLIAATLVVSAAATLGRASAADLDDGYFLRGSIAPPVQRWDGLNLGVQAGYGNLRTDFSGAPSSLVSYILRNTTVEDEFAPSGWTTLPSDVTNSVSYGGFIGYNWQWDQLVAGFDVGYNRPVSMETSASDTISRIVTTSDSVQHIVTITAASSLKLVDYATFRGRAGYAFGQFLPYAVLGAAVGRFNYANSATVTDIWTPSGGTATQFGPITDTESKNNAFAAGFLGGLGMDVALTPNIFVRGEWEYIAFSEVAGIKSNINTVRAGVGMRF